MEREMKVFEFGEHKLAALVGKDREVWLRAKDLTDLMWFLKSNVRELRKWLLDQVIPLDSETSPEPELVLKLNDEIKTKDTKIQLQEIVISKLQTSLAEIQRQLFQVEVKSVPRTLDEEKGNVFYLIKKNLEEVEDILDEYGFYAFRTHKRTVKETLKRIKEKFPNCKVVYSAEDPDEVDLYNRIENLEGVKTCENHLDTLMSEEELVEEIKKLMKDVVKKSQMETESVKKETNCLSMKNTSEHHCSFK